MPSRCAEEPELTTQIIPLSIDQLTEIGVTCYGPNWKAALCLAVSSTGLASLSERRLRYILSGRERVQEDVERGLLLVLQKRKREIESTIARMFRRSPRARPSPCRRRVLCLPSPGPSVPICRTTSAGICILRNTRNRRGSPPQSGFARRSEADPP